MNYILTIDIGGTFTKLACISTCGQLVEKEEADTPQLFGDFLQLVQSFYERNLTNNHWIIGIAISSPGSVTKSGEVLGYSSVPFIHDQNMKVLLEQQYKLPVFIENDANCAALAEMWNGAADGIDTYACIVCGTGIGGAIVINKKLYKGANLHGGEFGYVILGHDYGGKPAHYQTWSELGSSSAITRRLKEEAPYYEKWTGPLVFEEEKKGHRAAAKSIDTFFHTLAVGIFNIQYTLDPEKILIGGGVTRQPAFMEELATRLEAIYAEKPFATIRPNVSVCHYLDQAQLYGAAVGWKDLYWKGESSCLPE
ncbi:ROK family protein [Sutcliffiella halmapala]|uniref:ROK family protein n=1 Tax=Sutcliffiella halmapala TaxID=79882 RepID=UPI000995C219|nr:ROK family protein [Sutcliffiella halmapala]